MVMRTKFVMERRSSNPGNRDNDTFNENKQIRQAYSTDSVFKTTGFIEENAEKQVFAAPDVNTDDDKRSKYDAWYTVNIFLFFLASFQLLNLLTLTYTDSVLNFISKRFHIPNTMASFIPSSYQVGSTVAIIPVSYFGAKWHRPRAICVGVMFMLLGLGFCILPHFIMASDKGAMASGKDGRCHRTIPSAFVMRKYAREFKAHNITLPTTNWTIIESELFGNKTKSDDDDTEKSKSTWFTRILHNLASYYHSSNRLIKPSLTTPQELPCNANATMYNPSVLLILGHVFIGAGSTPLWPLGVAYLDEHLVSRKLPIYLGIFIGITLTGPVAGFLLGSLSSAIYVSIDAHDLKPSDPAWIGAWWLGYVIAATLMVILLVPFYFFPEKLKLSHEKIKENEEYQILIAEEISAAEAEADGGTVTAVFQDARDFHSEESIPLLCEEKNNGKKIYRAVRDLICSIRRLLSIPLVMCAFLAYVILANLLAGVSTFGSTFIQREFNVLRITSDMLIGGVCVPLAIAGTFGGGYLMKRFDFSTSQSLLFNVAMSSIGTVILSTLFALGCDTPITAGINRPYINEKVINITSECNKDCDCPHGEINLLCSKSNITYISPCYAGCTSHTPATKDGNTKEIYDDCSCVNELAQPLTMGPCTTNDCGRLLAGAMICASLGIMILCFCQAPTYTILLRSLRVEDKPLAIGLLTFLSRILGFIPAPIWFALVIDNSCIYWGPECMGKSVCKLYNNHGLRLNFVGGCVSCATGYAITFAAVASWFIYAESRDSNEDTPLIKVVEDRARPRDSRWERVSRMRSFTR
uniref:solute carrier organic anion transporter family member 2A1-like isoform X1 n=2 Tax=Styela clava TaxID=7725 RepID=UPI00193AC460|nr:solute carrier organic anion transporter family member 2A1-like isoform X1 [Styela clava]